MKGYDVIEALGMVEDAYVEEAGRGGRIRTVLFKRAGWIAAACLLLAVLPFAGIRVYERLSLPVPEGTVSTEPVSEEQIRSRGNGLAAVLTGGSSDQKLEQVQQDGGQPDRSADRITASAFVYEDWAAPTEDMVVSSYYGVHANGVFSDHINIAGEKGDEVFAVADGTILETGYKATHGNYIVLRLDENTTVRYGHLQDVYIGENAEVQKGAVIGTVGQTGMATGPNLSFTLYVNGEAANPLREAERQQEE